MRSVGLDGIFLHDPTALVAVLAPQLFGWHDGAVRVACDGLARGKTLLDTGAKKCAPGPHALPARTRLVACADAACHAAGWATTIGRGARSAALRCRSTRPAFSRW